QCRPSRVVVTIILRSNMKTRGKLKLTIYLLGFAGAALFTILLVRQGVMAVGAAVATAGWAIAAITAFHFVPILLDAIAWHVLFPKAVRPRWQSLFWMRWIGQALSNLMSSDSLRVDLVSACLPTTA